MSAGHGVANHVHGGNDTDSLVVTILFEQFLRKWKETGIDEAVILQDDSFLFVFEKPRDSGRYGTPAAKILFVQVSDKLARPVYIINNDTPCGFTVLRIFRMGRARAVGCKI